MDSTKPPQKLLARMRDMLRTQHYSIRTEQAYVEWAKRFILFHHKHHPKDLGVPSVEAFITGLAVVDHISASMPNQARSALLFLYRHMLNLDGDRSYSVLLDFTRANSIPLGFQTNHPPAKCEHPTSRQTDPSQNAKARFPDKKKSSFASRAATPLIWPNWSNGG